MNVTQVSISARTRAEPQFGVQRILGRSRLAEEVNRFRSGIQTLAWDGAAADHLAEVRAELQQSGTPIGMMDTMTGAHAKAIDAILVTNNVKHFSIIKGLVIENWIK